MTLRSCLISVVLLWSDQSLYYLCPIHLYCFVYSDCNILYDMLPMTCILWFFNYTATFYYQVPVPSQTSERSCICYRCVLELSILPLSVIFYWILELFLHRVIFSYTVLYFLLFSSF